MTAPRASTTAIETASRTAGQTVRKLEVGDGPQRLVAAGGLLAALGAGACCVVPFALFMLGIGGAWIGNLTALAPYQPIFVAVAFGLLGYGFYLVYRKPKVACADGSYCARPSAGRIAKTGLWTAAFMVLLAVTFSYWLPLVVET